MGKKFRKVMAMLLAVALVLPSFSGYEVFAASGDTIEGYFNLSIEELDNQAGKKNLALSWDEYKVMDANTRYYVARRNDQTGEWTLRGNYAKEISVLNLYPDISGSDGLQSWMENANAINENVHINVDKQSLSDFNSNPNRYLQKGSDGLYNYDVVVIGFWDSNNYLDIAGSPDNINTASGVIQDFINTGGGVMFGHDTVQHGTTNPNFINLIESNMGIEVMPNDKSKWVYSTKIGVAQQSSITSYPFDIYDAVNSGKYSLEIPLAHTVNQVPLNSSDTDPGSVYLTFEKNYYESDGSGPYYDYHANEGSAQDLDYLEYDLNGDGVNEKYMANAYFFMDNNVAFIQCGHSSGQTNEAEQMIIANAIYALATLYHAPYGIDQIIDTNRPTTPTLIDTDTTDDKIAFGSTDAGSSYTYRIIAVPEGVAAPDLNASGFVDDLNTAQGHDVGSVDNRYHFSNSVTVAVESGLNQFSYTIDNNPDNLDSNPATNVNATDVNGTKFTDINGNPSPLDAITATDSEEYDVLLPSEGLTNDMYMHVIAQDTANNYSSDVLTLNLYDVLPMITTYVNHYEVSDFEANGVSATEIGTQTVSEQKLGTPFSPAVSSIPPYLYNSSSPSTSIASIDAENNTINHLYDLPVTKTVNIVEHTNGEITDSYEYTTATLNAGTELPLDELIPDLENFTYDGFNFDEVSTTYNTDTVYTWTDADPDVIYLHYDRNLADVTYEFVDETNNNVVGEKTYTDQPVGDKVILSAKKSDVVNYSSFVNDDDIPKLRSHTVTEGTNTVTVPLTPKTKTISFFGYEYYAPDHANNGTTSFTGGNYSETYDSITGDTTVDINYDTPNGGSNEALDSALQSNPPKGATVLSLTSGAAVVPTAGESFGWTIVDSSKNRFIDFATTKNNYNIYYEAGIGVDGSYDYTVNYINSQSPDSTSDDIPLDASYSSGELDVFADSGLDVPEYIDQTISGAVNPVDFEPTTMVITDPNGDEHTVDLTKNEDFDKYLPVKYPIKGEILNGPYVVDIYYTPYSTITLTEKVKGFGDIALLGTTTTNDYQVLWDGTNYAKEALKDYDTYYVSETTDVDSIVQGVIDDEVTVKPNDYEHNLEIVYSPIKYNLVVNGILDTDPENPLEVYNFKNISIAEATPFLNPTITDFTFREAVAVDPSYADDISFNNRLTVFDPLATFDRASYAGEELVYNVNLVYSQNSEVVTKYYISPNIVTPVDKTVEYGYIGDTYTVEAPPIETENLELIKVYVDGENVTNNLLATKVSNEVILTKPHHSITYVYAPAKHTLTTTAGTGGVAFGSGEYAEGHKVILNAVPEEGYQFQNWTWVNQNGATISDLNNISPTITMPNGDVTIQANFVKTNTGGGGGDNGGGDNGGDGGDGGGSITNPPIEPVDPTLPVGPLNPGDIIEIIEDPIQEAVRAYIPYIQGYPDGNVEPQGYITRAEVMQAMYNLYGYGLFQDGYDHLDSLDNFSDVDEDDWYASAIAFCVDLGVVNGYADGTIHPDEPISRAELATILSKFMLDDEYADAGLSDVDGHWAEDAINELYDNGIIQGYPDGTFLPQRTTNRAEFVTMVNRLVHRPDEYYTYVTYPDLPETHWAYDAMMNASNGAVIGQDLDPEVIEAINDRLNK